MNENYLTIDQVANKLGVHPKTVRRYINSGKISAQKISGSWKINPESLDIYIDSCETNSCHQEQVSKDDFCIFMDSEYFDSEEVIQICTIVDYYVYDDSVKRLLKEVVEVVAEHSLDKNKSRFNYVYDDTDNKMRLVFWGAPSYIGKIIEVMKVYEKKA